MSAPFDPEPQLKEPLLRLLLAAVALIALLIAANDFAKADWELWWAYALTIFLCLAAIVLVKTWGYGRTSFVVIYALTVVIILTLIDLGYNGEHNVFLVTLYLIALILVGTLFLGRLEALLGQIAMIWLFFIAHLVHVVANHLITERAVTLNQQLVIPILLLLFVTIVALVIREVFNRIKVQYLNLAEGRLRGQEALGQLVRGIAHHLNTPLGNARMILSMASTSPHVVVDPAATHLIKSSVDVSIGLVSRLSGFMRLSDHPPQASATAPELESWFLGGQDLERRARFEASSEFLNHFLTPRTFAWETVNFIVTELLDNAWRHTSSEAEVPVVRADFRGPRTLILEVANEGRPIDPELRPRLRHPFFSSLVSSDHPGLGLFFADYLTQVALRGHLEIVHRANGTTVQLQIPLLSTAISESFA